VRLREPLTRPKDSPAGEYDPGVLLADRYELGDVLGTGAAATVYRARDGVLGRDVAIKVMKSTTADKRFDREARVLAQLRHPGAVDIYATGEHDGRRYLVMELVRAPTLEAVLEAGGPMRAEPASEIGAGLADVLAAAHALGIVHRDVKPANVFVDGSRVRLADFGLAFVDGRQDLGRLTSGDIVLGTPYYMAPEQIEGRDLGPAADVYALCATLYEVLAGRPPFQGATVPTILAGHLYLPPIPLAELPLAAPVPTEMAATILDGLAKDPAKRPDAATVALRLRMAPVLRGGRRRDTGTPSALRERAPVRVATPIEALAAALREAGVQVVAGDADVRVVDGATLAAVPDGSIPTVAVYASPTPPQIAAAIRAGYRAAVRWPGPIAPIATMLGRFGREIPGA